MNIENFYNIQSSIKEEYNAIKNGSGIHAVPDALIIQLNRKESLEFLHRISTNSVKDLNPFEKKNTLFLNEKGKFIDRTTLLNLDSFYLLICSPDENRKIFSWVNKYIIAEDIQTKDVSGEYSFIELIGPQTESYLTLLIGEEIKIITPNNIIYTHADGFSFYLYRDTISNGKTIFRILIEKERSAEFVNYMLENKSVFDVCLVGDDVIKIARVESGIASSPNEINDKYTPHETNLIDEVSFSKGCYIGQEVIARLDTYEKIQKKMVGLIIPNGIEINGSKNLLDESNNDAGEITSSVNSELLKKRIALGFIRKNILNENKTVFVKNSNEKIPLTICELPFKR
jgi:tRNA-modifying protein YgfZ